MSAEDAKLVAEFTNEILSRSGLQLSAKEETTDDGYKVELHGADVAILLGRNAELLDALEYLGSRLLAKHKGEERRIPFDCRHYRAQREKELRLMAEKAAEKVRLSKKAFTFDPMSPGDRRIIHLALSEQAGVASESQGSGENRKVTIFPA